MKTIIILGILTLSCGAFSADKIPEECNIFSEKSGSLETKGNVFQESPECITARYVYDMKKLIANDIPEECNVFSEKSGSLETKGNVFQESSECITAKANQEEQLKTIISEMVDKVTQ